MYANVISTGLDVLEGRKPKTFNAALSILICQCRFYLTAGLIAYLCGGRANRQSSG